MRRLTLVFFREGRASPIHLCRIRAGAVALASAGCPSRPLYRFRPVFPRSQDLPLCDRAILTDFLDDICPWSPPMPDNLPKSSDDRRPESVRSWQLPEAEIHPILPMPGGLSKSSNVSLNVKDASGIIFLNLPGLFLQILGLGNLNPCSPDRPRR